MTPTREQVLEAVRNAWDTQKRNEERIADAVMALLEPPKPEPGRWKLVVEFVPLDDLAIPHTEWVSQIVAKLCSVTFPNAKGVHPRELQVPSMEELRIAFRSGDPNSLSDGIRAVLAACGLEVGKP